MGSEEINSDTEIKTKFLNPVHQPKLATQTNEERGKNSINTNDIMGSGNPHLINQTPENPLDIIFTITINIFKSFPCPDQGEQEAVEVTQEHQSTDNLQRSNSQNMPFFTYSALWLRY